MYLAINPFMFMVIGPWQYIMILASLVIGFLVFPILALVDILRHNFTSNNKLVWVLIVLFLNVIGALLYFIIGRKHRLPKSSLEV